jgi:chromosome segregation ATPase
MIDKTEKRLDQLNYLLGDINMKIQSLSKEQRTVEDISSQLSAISIQSLEAKNMMLRLTEEKQVLLQEENKIVTMRKELDDVFASGHKSLDIFKGETALVAESIEGYKQNFELVIDEINVKIKTIEEYKAEIGKAEKQFAEVEKHLEHLRVEMDQINRRTTKIDAIDTRLVNVDMVVSDMEIKIESIDKGRDIVISTQKKIDSLNETVEKASQQIETINGKAKEQEEITDGPMYHCTYDGNGYAYDKPIRCG